MSDEIDFHNLGRMKLVEDDDGTAHISFDNVGTGRVCGACQLCCKLLPVPPLFKPAGQRCKHARHGKGCEIYASRPKACAMWSCRWLADPLTEGLPRPDRAHYVIDLEWDEVVVNNKTQSVLQVWIDPAFPNAHKAADFRAYLNRLAARWRVGALIRWDSKRSTLLVPPAVSDDGKWQEHETGTVVSRRTLSRLTGSDAKL